MSTRAMDLPVVLVLVLLGASCRGGESGAPPRSEIVVLAASSLQDAVVALAEPDVRLNAEHWWSIQVMSGLERGKLTRALAGEHVGAISLADRRARTLYDGSWLGTRPERLDARGGLA